MPGPAGVLTGYAVDGVRRDARSATRASQERAPQDRASQGPRAGGRGVGGPTPTLAGGVPVALPIPPVHPALWLLAAAAALPFPALLADAVAQDGDALLPLLALDRAAAARTTVLTSAPALAAGFLALALV